MLGPLEFCVCVYVFVLTRTDVPRYVSPTKGMICDLVHNQCFLFCRLLSRCFRVWLDVTACGEREYAVDEGFDYHPLRNNGMEPLQLSFSFIGSGRRSFNQDLDLDDL